MVSTRHCHMMSSTHIPYGGLPTGDALFDTRRGKDGSPLAASRSRVDDPGKRGCVLRAAGCELRAAGCWLRSRQLRSSVHTVDCAALPSGLVSFHLEHVSTAMSAREWMQNEDGGCNSNSVMVMAMAMAMVSG